MSAAGSAGNAAADRSRRREYVLALLVTAAAAGGVLAATSRPWAVGAVERSGPTAAATVEIPAGEIAPLADAVGWAGVAALAALVATRGWGRRAVGVILIGFGVACLTDIRRGTDEANVAALAEREAVTGEAATSVELVAVWPWVGAAAAAVLALVGVATVVRGASWPVMSARYDRHDTRSEDRGDDPVALWNSLSSGADPTAESARGDTAPAPKPEERGSATVDDANQRSADGREP